MRCFIYLGHNFPELCAQLTLFPALCGKDCSDYTHTNQNHFTGSGVPVMLPRGIYRKTSNISRTLVSNEIVDNSDVVGASPAGAAPTTSSFST